MKKFIIGLLVGFLLSTATLAMANPQAIKLIVNGTEIISEVPPQVINGRTMIPARPLAEALGAEVSWDTARNAIIVNSTNSTIESEESVKEGIDLSSMQKYQKDGYTFIIENEVEYYSLRYVHDMIEKKGVGIGYNGDTEEVYMSYSGSDLFDTSKAILREIPSKIFNGSRFIEKAYFYNTILPLAQ